jgi:hypothetical protein
MAGVLTPLERVAPPLAIGSYGPREYQDRQFLGGPAEQAAMMNSERRASNRRPKSESSRDVGKLATPIGSRRTSEIATPLLASTGDRRRIAMPTKKRRCSMSVDNPANPIVIGRSEESFAVAAQNAVADWETQRGRPPEELTTLRVIDMYCTVGPSSFHDYIIVLENRP